MTDEIPLPTRTGQVLDIRAHTVPLRDGAGQFSGVLAVHEDVTERKQLEAQLLQAQKMETVGRLAGGVAHDFNNILTAVMGYTDLALEMTREPDVRDALETTRVAAQRAAGLTQQLLAFSRRQVLQPAVVNANEVVLGMEQILRRLIGEDVELMTSVDPGAGSIVVDRTQLEQVILNLAVNARDAMPDGGRLVIRTERARFTGSHAHLELAPGDYVMISVTDTGTGMDDETKARIFEPFFTTKETGKGTGLGLATTYGIVRQSGGHIWVYSEPGRGTTFKLYFPRVGGQPAEVAEPEAARPARRGRILFVEDEPVLRELGQRVLRRSGYDVAVAKDPADALAMVGEGVLPFDLLLTDVVMPGMTGVELARRLHAIRPGVPVLFMSGYAEDVIDADAAASRRFLAKPFAPDALLRAVDAAIGAAAVEDAGSSESR